MNIEWNLILRLLVAGLLGGMIGLEREFRAKEAGVRTHFIVALGSSLFMIISQFAFSGQFDHARVAAQVVSGIGFIGAGVIIFQKNVVRGITTAAGLWVAAAIGLACGSGMYDISIAATLMTISCLETMHFITRKIGEKIFSVSITETDPEVLVSLAETFKKSGVDVESMAITEGKAVFQIRSHQKDYLSLVKKILTLTKDLKVEIV
ncbi:MAG: MgtC/SapB family protein [Bacteroidales bacterium]|nr:MgtC/SapB family protein [Bacteroidales bacterium]